VRTEFADTAGMAGAKLFDMPNTMTAEAVAAAAIRATRRGRRLVIPGFLNQLITIMVVWLPKSILLRVVMRLQTNRRQPAGRDSS
jgi:short-subunit dehydrogenase